jgi:hypothetical protein
MRFRLLRRRLTISAPTMAIRSHMPWPLKWALAAVVLGFCSAIALWAFEFGKDIAGLDRNAKQELVLLREDLDRTRQERDKAQAQANSSSVLMTAEQAAQSALANQIKVLEAENRQLRDDLGFYEKLIPTASADGVTIRGFSTQLLTPTQLKWQFLVVFAAKKAPDFNGRYEMVLSGTVQGKAWTMTTPAADLSFKQLGRFQGTLDLPAQTVVKSVTLKVFEGGTQRAVQINKL